jgi:hypothetical protein
MLTWFDYVKPRLASGESMQQASAEYCKQYLPDIYTDAKLIADETIASAGKLPAPPPEAEIPEDLPFGIQLVSSIIEDRILNP